MVLDMLNFTRAFSGGFFRTLGKIFAFLLVGFLISLLTGFVNIGNVHALENTYYYSGLNISTMGLYTDNASATATGESIGYEIVENTFRDNNTYIVAYPTSMLNNRLGIYGNSLTQCDMSFLADNYYSVTYYFSHGLNPYPFWSYSQVTNHLAISNSSATSYIYRNFNPINSTTDVQTQASFAAAGGYVSSFTVVFKAPNNGTCLTMAYSSSNTNTLIGEYGFLGYQYKSLGSKSPSADEIKSVLDSSFDTINSNFNKIENNIMTGINTSINSVNDNINNATNDINNSIDNSTNNINGNINNSTNEINNNINDMNTSINNNIDDMKNKQDETNNSINSEDDDVSNKKCGIICKLKGIWTGITHLPENIWNFLKAGFNAITDGLTSLWNGIKDLFTPKEECTTSSNLLDLSNHVFTYGEENSNTEFLDNGFKFTSLNNHATTLQFTIPKDKVSNKTIYISFKSKLNSTNKGRIDICPNNNCLFTYSINSSDTSLYYDLPTLNTDLKIKFYSQSYTGYLFEGNYIEYSDIMVNIGDNYLPYEPFGETCTGGGTIFTWFGDIFKNLWKNITGFFGSEDIDNEQSNGFFNDFEDIDHGGISGVITAPLSAVNKINQSCSAVSLTLWEKDISLPCGDTLFWNKPDVVSFRTIWNILVGGPIIYFLMLKLFHVIQGLKNPDDSRIEVAKL